MRVAINSDRIPRPVGPFSPAVRARDTIYLSGQVAQDPATGRLIDGGAAAQTARILDNVRAILESAGRTLDHVLRVSIYLTSMNDFAAVNDVYVTYFNAPFPARTTVSVVALPLGAAVEIKVVAGAAESQDVTATGS